MDKFGLIIFIGVILFFMFRKGGMAGMGCCGGHGGHGSSDSRNARTERSGSNRDNSQIIDLSEADYSVLPARSEENQVKPNN